MRLPCAAGQRLTEAFFRPGFSIAALLVGLSLTGCDNTCLRFTSNSSTGVISVNANDSKSCALDSASGTVSVEMISGAPPAAAAGPSSIRHIFLTVRGVEADPGAAAAEASPGWLELAPRLARQPVQVDLMAAEAASARPNALGEAAIPAGMYRRIRLRLLPDGSAAGAGPAPATNACGSVGWNCVVTADGRPRALVFEDASPEVRIASERIAGGAILVLPGVATHLAIRFDPYRSSLAPAGDAVRLLPWLTAAAR
jgi:Domain of unknown function (DUF4382)